MNEWLDRDQTLVQHLIERLVRVYGFDQTQLALNQTLHLRQPARKVRLAVVAFPEGALHQDLQQAIRVCLVRPHNRPEDDLHGLDLLDQVLQALPNCEAGLWTNGEISRARAVPDFLDAAIDLPDLPRCGETWAETFRSIRPVLFSSATGSSRTLLQTLDAVLRRLWNLGLSGMDEFWEVAYLIALLQHGQRLPVSAAQAGQMFEELRRTAPLLDGTGLRIRDEAILLDICRQLEPFVHSPAAGEIYGLAYELSNSKVSRGQRGQYFTPANCVEMMASMVVPYLAAVNPDGFPPRVIDPACGDGRLLQVTARHLSQAAASLAYPDLPPALAINSAEVRQRAARCIAPRLYGVELDWALHSLAKLNLTASVGHPGNLFAGDALEIARGRFPDLVEGTFDLVLSNPPFGLELAIDDPALLAAYDLETWSNGPGGSKSVPPELLFLELCVRLARPGTGIVALVLPEAVLQKSYSTGWVLERCQVLASISLPRELFLPRVGIKTSVLLLRRRYPDEPKPNYPIFMAIAETVGHDSRGKIMYETDGGGYRLQESTVQALRWAHGQPVPVQVSLRHLIVDDDLPRIVAHFQEFVRAHRAEMFYVGSTEGMLER